MFYFSTLPTRSSTESAGRDVTIKFYPPAKNFSTAEIFFDDWQICTTCPNESFPDTSKVIRVCSHY